MQFNSSIFNTDVTPIPERTGEINKKHIKQKLEELGVNLSDISLGDFDSIGEFTAKKQRSRDSDLYKSVGAFFRPNYERGILIYTLIKKHKLESFLEIGFGRGYGCFCAALAFHELGRGKIVSVDPALDENYLNQLATVFPKDWFDLVQFKKYTSDDYFSESNENFDLIYLDGDHRYEFVKRDWENSKDRFNKFLLFDDYHLPSKVQKDIDVSNLVDSIDDKSKELIIMDRRIFFDDRQIADNDIDYGQVLLSK
tara:strand:- start:352 stop:1113 length:762 start_codon:yes stop_codon:yes gene_type:complete